MLKWFKKGDSQQDTAELTPFREIDGATDLKELLSGDTVMVFKHSTACPVSWSAHRQVQKFLEGHPGYPLYIVPVIQERVASNNIAQLTSVRHESPQVILLKDGSVVAAISHGEITASQLERLIAD